jgi:hypothetical protein
MDWNTFISSIISALAWPIVVGVLIYYLRSELPSMVRRLKRASIAGGKLDFTEALEQGRKEVELVASDRPELIRGVRVDAKRLELAQRFPEVAVIESFKDIEDKLLELRDVFGIAPRSNLRTVLHNLVERGLVDPEVEPLFLFLQRARNTSAHASRERSVTPGEAMDYMDQANFVVRILEQVAEATPAKQK